MRTFFLNAIIFSLNLKCFIDCLLTYHFILCCNYIEKAACIHHLIEMIPSSHNTSVAIGELHRVPAHSIISHLSEQLSELETSSEIVQEQIEASQNIDDPTRALQRQRRPRTQSRFRKAISIIRNRIRSRTRWVGWKIFFWIFKDTRW